MGDSVAGDSKIPIEVRFSGGLETLFKKEQDTLSLPAKDKRRNGSPSTIQTLIDDLCGELSEDHLKFFIEKGGYLRGGILVLINEEEDWELKGEENYELRAGDKILFLSMLHGG